MTQVFDTDKPVTFDELVATITKAILAWGQAQQHAPKTTSNSSESSNIEVPLITDQEQELLRLREEAGRKIDPKTAQVKWQWGWSLYPYRIYPYDPDKLLQRNYFARSPGTKMWVHFNDLPEATCRILSNSSPSTYPGIGRTLEQHRAAKRRLGFKKFI